MLQGRYAFPAIERIVFGVPCKRAVADEAAAFGAKRVFVVSTRSLASLSEGPLKAVEAGLGRRHAGTFGAIGAHAPDRDVIKAAAAARDARADLLVAVGGGSVIDAAKVALRCLWYGLHGLSELRAAAMAPPEPMVPRRSHALRMIAVPTTLSAAEFMPSAGFLDTASGEKRRLAHRDFAPRAIVLDPQATMATPRVLFFSTGIRAIDHAVETHCAPESTPMTEFAGLAGVGELASALRDVAARPRDVEARLRAQIGVWKCVTPAMAGVGVGASHGIGYALGARLGMPHGITSCVMLPAVLRWNAAVDEARQAALSAALGAPDRPVADLIANLLANLDLPRSLRAAGVPRGALRQLAEDALAYEPVRRNPRPITSAADVEAILRLAW